MAINIVRYRAGGKILWGVRVSRGVLPLGEYRTTAEFLRSGAERAREQALRLEVGNGLALDDVDSSQLLSPITAPCRVVCQALNYRDHMLDSGIDPEKQSFNVFFTKSSASVAAPHADIMRPKHVELLDYEIELGLVIGKEISRPTEIAPGNLSEYVAGLVMGNDVTARDVQLPQGQYFKGKSYRTFCPLGPHLCLLDASEFAMIDDLDLRLRVNDELRQQGNTRDLVHKPARTLSELSEFCDLEAGDVVLTGTPAGCAVRAPRSKLLNLVGRLLPEAKKWQIFIKNQRKNPRYLKPGDRMETWIRSADGCIDLGVQTNRILQAEHTPAEAP